MSALETPTVGEFVIELTDDAHSKLIELRDEEPEKEALGLRLEIISKPGEVFRYDLAFDVIDTCDPTDLVYDHGGLGVIIPEKDTDKLRGALLDFDEKSGLVLRNPNKPEPVRPEGLTYDDELAARIEAEITAEVNPALSAHAGYITFVGHDGQGTAYVTMGGSCHGCAMSTMTMLNSVQTMLCAAIPELFRVQDVTDHSNGENPYYS